MAIPAKAGISDYHRNDYQSEPELASFSLLKNASTASCFLSPIEAIAVLSQKAHERRSSAASPWTAGAWLVPLP